MIGLVFHVLLSSTLVYGQRVPVHDALIFGTGYDVSTTSWQLGSRFAQSGEDVRSPFVALPVYDAPVISVLTHSHIGDPTDSHTTGPPQHDHRGKDKENALFPYLRYLWWVVVLYFFWAQACVCDEYFVPTLEAISDKFGIPDDVAGATIMALGCNGPELFINTVALFRASDLGIGAVLGGEVFNLLVLSGCAVLATPAIFMPLRISKLSFSRDVFFYALSIGLIYWTLYDQQIILANVLALLGSGVLYSATVIITPKIRSYVDHCRKKPACGSSSQLAVDIEDAWEAPEDPNCSNASPGPENGCFLAIRVNMLSRMQDRFRHWETRFVTLVKDGLIVSTDVRDMGSRYGRTARGIVFEHNSKDGLGRWRHGGLVNTPTARKKAVEAEVTSMSAHELAHPELAAGSGAIILPRTSSDPEIAVASFRSEFIPLSDVVCCVEPVSTTSTCFELQVLQHDSTLRKVIGLELDAKTCDMRNQWISAIKHNLQLRVQNRELDDYSSTTLYEGTHITMDATAARPAKSLLIEWVEWFQFPVKFLLRVSVPNAKRLGWRMPVSFLMSMLWLALFSFCVVEVCDILADEFNISVTVLGFTVAAVGTSFPNVISCIAVSRQGKTLMAIANALGANIQNVFIALALPWFFRWLVKGDFYVTSGNLNATVIAMVGTLVLLVLVVLLAGCKMARWGGVIFLLMYGVYLVVTFGQEFACVTWPFCAK